LGAEPSISQTVRVPPDALGVAGLVLPAHAGDADEAAAGVPPPELPLLWLGVLLPQPAAASATVAAQTANRVTRFTVAVLPCPVRVLTGLV
jgi:hypothetical protein